MRIAQFKHCCQIAQNCITKFNLENRLLIEVIYDPSQTDICNKYLSDIPFKLKLLNTKPEYTSNLRFQKDLDTKQWYTLNRKEKLDYLIGSTDFKITKETVLPKSDITESPNWGLRFDLDIYNQLPKFKNWPSDHKLVSFLLEYENGPKKTPKKRRSLRKTTKKKK